MRSNARPRLAALILALAACQPALAGDPGEYSLTIPIASWERGRDDHTREVLPVRPDLTLWNEGKSLPPRNSARIYVVKRTEQGRLLIKQEGLPWREGWVSAGDVVPFKQAEAYFSAAIRADDRKAFPLVMRGLIRHHLDDNDLALADLDEALRREPDRTEALAWRASVHVSKHHRDEAIADLDRAIELSPTDALLFNARALVHASTGGKDRDRALADVDRAIQLDPSESFFFWTRAAVHYGRDRRNEAIRDLHAAIRHSADPEFVLMTAINMVRMKEHQAAREIVKARLDQHPDRELAYKCHLAMAYIDASDSRRASARAELSRAIAIDPGKEDAYLFRAAISGTQGFERQSIDDLNAAIRANPSNAESYEARAVLHYHEGEYPAAVADMETAIRRKPEDPEFHQRLALMLATCPEAGIRNGLEAVAQASRACELSRWRSPTALDALAAAEAEIGHFHAAAGHEERAIFLLPDHDRREDGYRDSLDRYKDGKPSYRLGLLEEWGLRPSHRLAN